MAGLAIALVLGRSVAHVLIGIAPHDLVALASAAGIAVAAGLVATWLPARRAARTDPIEALKAE